MKRRENTMKQTFELLGYKEILRKLKEYANTNQAKKMIEEMEPLLSETEIGKKLRETTEARQLLEEIGNPPLPIMENIEEYMDKIEKGELLLPEQIEEIGMFIVAVKRLKVFLEKGKEKQISLAFYSENLVIHHELLKEIETSIHAGKIDDYATKTLRDIRRQLQQLEERIKEKAEHVLRKNKAYMADSYVVNRNGKVCVPVKSQYKNKIKGTKEGKSATGATIFIEPSEVTQYREEYEILKISEDVEERRILYTIIGGILDREIEIRENIRVVIILDFIFAKGKMSSYMEAVEPKINVEQRIVLEEARNPLLSKEECVPLNFQVGKNVRGIIITGPNTGGKTVAIKTVGLLCILACSGLHVPAQYADITINNQVLCDIGDGQSIQDNLSTFSSHIQNIMRIIRKVNKESLVILDELGSGTDPEEGMGIAIAILEELRQSGALFLVTTHYPKVKEYAERYEEIINARMAFDRENLKPLYQLEIGKAGKSCALYIAKRLGVPKKILMQAAYEAYGNGAEAMIAELDLNVLNEKVQKDLVPSIQRKKVAKKEAVHGEGFSRGDSVLISPENKLGIVVKPADKSGNVLVQVKKEKKIINHKHLKLKVAAKELYPEDYDFSILFDTVENRKKRHKMGKKFQEDLVIYTEE